jgi:hypothetical protein
VPQKCVPSAGKKNPLRLLDGKTEYLENAIRSVNNVQLYDLLNGTMTTENGK